MMRFRSLGLPSRALNTFDYVCSTRSIKAARIHHRHSSSSSYSLRDNFYDVVVVGGGPAGLSLLAALRSSPVTSNLRFALIESQHLGKLRTWNLPPDVYSNRISSLTPASMSFLRQIGVELDQTRLQAYHHMRVWDGLSSTGKIAFDSSSSGPPIAYMTENQNTVKALINRLDSLSGIDYYDGQTVASIQLGSPHDPNSSDLDLSLHPHISVSSGRTLVARLLVGADGFNSPVRAFAGIDTRGWDYDRQGVVATLQVEGDGSRTAYQRFLPTGPIALLPLPQGRASLVWTTTAERAARLKALKSCDFIAMVNAAFRLDMVDLDYMFSQASGHAEEFRWRWEIKKAGMVHENHDLPGLVSAIQEASTASFPLRLRQATTYKADRVALVGDAAHTIHPLAGQGLNMGLADSRALASVITDSLRIGADIGNELTCLDQFNSDTWLSNNRMLGAVDKLHWLYSAQAAPIVGLRSFGLSLVNQAGPLKQWFMSQAGAI